VYGTQHNTTQQTPTISQQTRNFFNYFLSLTFSSTLSLIDDVDKFQDKYWGDSKAKEMLTKIFDSLGSDHELTKKSRRRLSNIWF
jgi:hypothetical protein